MEPTRAECAAIVARAYGISVVEVERSGFYYRGRYFEPLWQITKRLAQDSPPHPHPEGKEG